MELWDAYDENFHVIEGISLVRGEKIPEGIYHLVCGITVRHKDGTYLLMQRDMNKYLGGLWELSAGGSAVKGEDPHDCALRELKEETGIEAGELRELRRYVHKDHHSLHIDYLCMTDHEKNSVVLQEGETIAYKWSSRDEILKMPQDILAWPNIPELFDILLAE